MWLVFHLCFTLHLQALHLYLEEVNYYYYYYYYYALVVSLQSVKRCFLDTAGYNISLLTNEWLAYLERESERAFDTIQKRETFENKHFFCSVAFNCNFDTRTSVRSLRITMG